MMLIGCGESGGAAETPDAGPTFGHSSPRPECLYTIDESRVPYAMPQVVASDFGDPVLLPTLNTDCPEDAIEISRDGRTLYFFWSQTIDPSPDELLNGTTGTYHATRSGSDPGFFTDPRFFELRKGSAGGALDGEPSFSPEGDQVYFHSLRASNTGYLQSPPVDDPMDIYVADIMEGEPGPARNLGPPVNTIYLDGEHCLSPDGSKLYLTSTRPGGLGKADIWVSTWTTGSWSEPENLGSTINSVSQELQPAFAAQDPDTIYFVSDRDGPNGIYRSVLVNGSFGEPEPIITGYVGEPTLVADGTILYFVHVLVDDNGVFGSDIWYVAKLD